MLIFASIGLQIRYNWSQIRHNWLSDYKSGTTGTTDTAVTQTFTPIYFCSKISIKISSFPNKKGIFAN